MRTKIFIVALIAIAIVGCKNNNNNDVQSHNHEADAVDAGGHVHEIIKTNYTGYSSRFELYAEADVFVLGEPSHILAHFTNLPEFTPVRDAEILISLDVDGAESHQKVLKPFKPGIYKFEIKPRKAGLGNLKFNIQVDGKDFELFVPDVTVFPDEHSSNHGAIPTDEVPVNSIAFTKEQSWKIDFATELPMIEPIGQVIKTTAQIHSTPKDEILVSAGIVGVVSLSAVGILEGREVRSGEELITISGNDLMDNNSEVRYIEAKANFEFADSQYQRAKELAKDKIVSEKELQLTKNSFENAKVIYNNLNESYNSAGQCITSPVDGFIKQLLVQNGQYVEVGQPIISISKNKSLFLHADVQQKYHSVLDDISSATIRMFYDKKVYTLEGLNGKIVSYGRTTNIHNFLIPINLEIDYVEGFMPGSFVELYLKSVTDHDALTIPVTALLENQGNYFVFVQINPELFEMREVKIGVTDGIKTEILKGISVKERVVTQGATLVKLAKSSGGLDAHSGHVH